uniref:Mevalonate kinase n=1 Tax=Romanomermis culicivorax TaxID=13658 RepID=A0A915L0Y3_ROMCU
MTVNELYLSAPGKAILFGEHSVVYGRTAVAGSIDLRTYLSLYTSNDGRIYLCLPDIGVEKTWMLKDFLQIAEELDDVDLSDDSAPSLELLVPLARRLIGGGSQADDPSSSGVQNLAVLAFLFVLLGVAQRRSIFPTKSMGVPMATIWIAIGLENPGAVAQWLAIWSTISG